METNQEIDQQNISSQPLLTAKEVSHRLHLSRSCTYDLMASGELATIWIGKSRRVRLQDLEAFILRNIHSKETDV